jgi:hypothetical protein
LRARVSAHDFRPAKRIVLAPAFVIDGKSEYSFFFGHEHPSQNHEGGPTCVGDEIPQVGLSLGNKPLMNFV